MTMKRVYHPLCFAIGSLVLVAGCLDISPANRAWKCSTAGLCPSGYVCEQTTNSCVRSAGGGPAGPVSATPDHDKTTVTVSSTTVAADGKSTGMATVTVADASGAAIPGATVAFKASDAFVSFSGQSSSTTDQNGVVTVSVSSTSGGPKTITATVTWTINNVSGIFDVSSTTPLAFQSIASPDKSTIDFVPVSGVMANNNTDVTANIVIKDYSGAIMVGVPVGLQATGGGVTVDAPPQQTNAFGASSGGFKSSTPGKKTITLTANGNVLVSKDFSFDPVTVFSLKFASNQIQTAGHDLNQFSITAYDSTNTPLTTVSAAITVSLATDQAGDPSDGQLSGTGNTTVSTDGTGKAVFSGLNAKPNGGAACSGATGNCTFYMKATTPGANGTNVSAVVGPFTVSDASLSTPSINDVAALPGKLSTLSITWTPNGMPTPTKFWVLRSTDQHTGFVSLTTTPVTGNSYLDKNLPHGTYYYEVLATTKTTAGDTNPDHTDSPPPAAGSGNEAWREICVANTNGVNPGSGMLVLPAFSSSANAANTKPSPIRAINSDVVRTLAKPKAIAVDSVANPTRIFIANNNPNGTDGYTIVGGYQRTDDTLTNSGLTPTSEIHVAPVAAGGKVIITSIAYVPVDGVNDEIVVVDNSENAVIAYKISGSLSWALYGGSTDVVTPYAVAANPTSGDVQIFVTNYDPNVTPPLNQQMINVYSRNAILRSPPANKIVTNVPPSSVITNSSQSLPSGTAVNAISSPRGLTIAGTSLFVANTGTPGTITRFNIGDPNQPFGKWLGQFSPGSNRLPQSVAVDLAGNMLFLVTSTGNNVSVFSVAGDSSYGDILPDNSGLSSPFTVTFCN
jgi:hypothetical protein